jgi:methionyl-tRNA formyltransferase
MINRNLRILFLGTPDFATGILKELIINHFNIVGVVTNIDKPAGRTQKVTKSSVKIFAEENNLRIFQPEKLKNEEFLNDLRTLNIDIGVVVAFRILPEILWTLPRLGTINLHASLLPLYRGAAPINHVIINGEKETGITTFFLQHDIDTGKIIFQEKTVISENDNAGSLHDKLMYSGSKLVVKTLEAIETGIYPEIDQSSLISDNGVLKIAPKIFKNDCKINWQDEAVQIHNFIRGLSPHPCAWTTLELPSKKVLSLKIFEASVAESNNVSPPGNILTDGKNFLKISTANGSINVMELQIEGKKRLKVRDFLIGFNNIDKCILK